MKHRNFIKYIEKRKAKINIKWKKLAKYRVTIKYGNKIAKQFTVSLPNLNKALEEFLSLYKQGKANSLKIVRLK